MNCIIKGIGRTDAKLSQRSLHFRPELFNRIQIRTVWRQIKDLCSSTMQQFTSIGEKMDGLNGDVQEIYGKIEEILTSNQAIVDSINQISAVSQEVFASTQQAVELGEDTNQQAQQVRECMEELKRTVDSVGRYAAE